MEDLTVEAVEERALLASWQKPPCTPNENGRVLEYKLMTTCQQGSTIILVSLFLLKKLKIV